MMNGELENFESLAMVAQNRSFKNQQEKTTPNQQKNGIDKSTYKCTHCDRTGHTKKRCFELVGYSEWWDHSQDPHKRHSKKSSTAAVVET